LKTESETMTKIIYKLENKIKTTIIFLTLKLKL